METDRVTCMLLMYQLRETVCEFMYLNFSEFGRVVVVV